MASLTIRQPVLRQTKPWRNI